MAWHKVERSKEMKKYIKPQAVVNSFVTEDVIAASGTTVTPATLKAMQGANLGAVNRLFNK